MIARLPDERRQAIQQNPNELRLEDEQTSAVYLVVNEEAHSRAMKALKAREDWDSVQPGLKGRERGNELPLVEADAQMRLKLGFAPRA